MNISSPTFQALTNPVLLTELQNYRKRRGFEAEKVVQQKQELLAKYCTDWQIDTLIVPVSGGVDSAVVAALTAVVTQKNQTLKKVILLFIPQFNEGSSNQADAQKKVELLADKLQVELITFDISNLHQTVIEELNKKSLSSGWLKGQVTTYLRTPVWYSLAAQLAEAGHRAIVSGTINFDEGSYLGYFSKSSDAMTDIQLISDLHKSEVKKIAEYFRIPEEIRNAIPNGDMYDNRNDEAVFGTSYDFVELYSWFLQLPEAEQARKLKGWPAAAQKEFERMRANLERLHEYNRHKYTVAPQGLHFTVFEATIPGGWTLVKYV